ncbi:MAG: hypothetical protein AAB654_06745, partial [Acidobacteriota bacterium]
MQSTVDRFKSTGLDREIRVPAVRGRAASSAWVRVACALLLAGVLAGCAKAPRPAPTEVVLAPAGALPTSPMDP